MKQLFAVVLLAFSLGNICSYCETGDDTLDFYTSKSELIVIGTLVYDTGGFTIDLGVEHHGCKIDVKDVLKGDQTLKGQVIQIDAWRFYRNISDEHPSLQRGKDCILFLKHTGPNQSSPPWITVDPWFGIQPPSRMMVEALKRLTGNYTDADKIEFGVKNSRLVISGKVSGNAVGDSGASNEVEILEVFKAPEDFKRPKTIVVYHLGEKITRGESFTNTFLLFLRLDNFVPTGCFVPIETEDSVLPANDHYVGVLRSVLVEPK